MKWFLSLRLLGTAIAYALIAFIVLWVGSILSWVFFPCPHGAGPLLLRNIYAWHNIFEYLFALLLACIIAFLAARTFQETWKLGLVAGIIAATTHQCVIIVFHLFPSGFHKYLRHNEFIPTMFVAIAFGALFSFIGVWKQYRRELATEENFINTMTDIDWAWWPVLSLRPPKDKDIDNLVVLKITCFAGPIGGLTVVVLALIQLPHLIFTSIVLYFLLGCFLFFCQFKFVVVTAWNKRARRLRNNPTQPEHEA